LQATKIFQVASSSERKPNFLFQASAAAHVHLSLPLSPPQVCESVLEKYSFTEFVETVQSLSKKKTPGMVDWFRLGVSASVMF